MPNPMHHDPTDPISELNRLEAALLACRITCPHCTVDTQCIPMGGIGWGVEVFHEPGCPDHDENLPTPRRSGTS